MTDTLRVIHLFVGPVDRGQLSMLQSLLGQGSDMVRHEVVALGNDTADSLSQAGCSAFHTVPIRWQTRLSAVPGLSRIFAGAELKLLQAWGTGAMRFACKAFRKKAVLGVIDRTDFNRSDVYIAATAVRIGQVHAACTAECIRQSLVDEHLLPIQDTTVIAPALSTDYGAGTERCPLYRHPGMQSEGPLMLVADPIRRESGHFEAAWAGGILEYVYPSTRCILLGDGPFAGELRRQTQRMGLGRVAYFPPAELTLLHALMACDVLLVPHPRALPTVAMLAARQLGKPVVAVEHPAVHDIMGTYPHLYTAARSKPRDLAEAVLRCYDDTLGTETACCGPDGADTASSVRNIAAAFEAHYQRMLPRRPTPYYYDRTRRKPSAGGFLRRITRRQDTK